MGTWFWLNIPVALVFFGCWAGIPLWHTLRRWNAEVNAKHAELAARAVPQPVLAAQAPDAMSETRVLASAGSPASAA